MKIVHPNENRIVKRQILTFDNGDTIPVCHHNGMKTFNTKRTTGSYYYYEWLNTAHSGSVNWLQSYTPLQLLVQVSLQVLQKQEKNLYSSCADLASLDALFSCVGQVSALPLQENVSSFHWNLFYLNYQKWKATKHLMHSHSLQNYISHSPSKFGLWKFDIYV